MTAVAFVAIRTGQSLSEVHRPGIGASGRRPWDREKNLGGAGLCNPGCKICRATHLTCGATHLQPIARPRSGGCRRPKIFLVLQRCCQRCCQRSRRILRSMTCNPTPVINRLVEWPDTVGSSRVARRAVAGWADDPVLSAFATPGAAAEAVRFDTPEAAAVLGALAARPRDEWAATAALVGLAVRLLPIVRRWARGGLKGPQLAAAEADLLAAAIEVLAAMHPTPAPAQVVTTAWQRVYGARRTETSRAARREPLPVALPAPAGNEHSTVEALLAVLTEGVRRRSLPRSQAQALAAWAAGWSTIANAELAFVGVAAIRARRRRGLAALTAANAADGGW